MVNLHPVHGFRFAALLNKKHNKFGKDPEKIDLNTKKPSKKR